MTTNTSISNTEYDYLLAAIESYNESPMFSASGFSFVFESKEKNISVYQGNARVGGVPPSTCALSLFYCNTIKAEYAKEEFERVLKDLSN